MIMKKIFWIIGSVALMTGVLSSCNNGGKQAKEATQAQEESTLTLSGLDASKFTQPIKGKEGKFYVLTNKNGLEMCVSNVGARIVSMMVPDKDGKMQDVVLGFDNAKDYATIDNNFGATIGRYANRIGNATFKLDDQTYNLPQNNNGHCLHGGDEGFDKYIFDEGAVSANSVTLKITSPDGDANFPGKLDAQVTFTLTDDNAIDIQYVATSDKKTIINMTNHSYFNLSGDPSKSAIDHILYLNADQYTPVDETLIPTGEFVAVANTPMDFTTPKTVADDIEKVDFIQIKYGRGFDHNWVLNTNGNDKEVAARMKSPTSGIVMEVYTDEPGLQVYTGNFLDGTIKGKKGITYNQRASICLETQHYPDSPNKADWPSVVLEPGATYSSHTVYKFSVEK